MKVDLTRVSPTFQPVELRIIIETQEEFDVMYQAGNYSGGIAGFLEKVDEGVDTKVANKVFMSIWQELHKHKNAMEID